MSCDKDVEKATFLSTGMSVLQFEIFDVNILRSFSMFLLFAQNFLSSLFRHFASVRAGPYYSLFTVIHDRLWISESRCFTNSESSFYCRGSRPFVAFRLGKWSQNTAHRGWARKDGSRRFPVLLRTSPLLSSKVMLTQCQLGMTLEHAKILQV